MKQNNVILDSRKEYVLSLANGQGWSLIADETTVSWLDRLANIMKLKQGGQNDYQKVYFTQRGSDRDNFRHILRKNGWINQERKNIQFWRQKKSTNIICEFVECEWSPVLDFIRMYMVVGILYRQIWASEGVPLHAALVQLHDRGVVLAAPGSTGKSTCCQRIPIPWQALSDDETVIVRGDNGAYFAHPFPTWSEYIGQSAARSWQVQKSVPLSAIFFLEQAPIDEVIPIGQGQAAVYLRQSADEAGYRALSKLERTDRIKLKTMLFHNVCELSSLIPGFVLQASLTGKFWDKIEQVIS
ncbi:MAG: SynChlorMet cassette protein ScmC [bacterium]